ncbi:FAD-binding oxidoreductase [Nonomuraea sp. NPDC050536]|uniref:FAD-binding oxidoreductase n=1 Tax=Nonomuraea sp. NPDC050536 TaxID=3364366 RepID=UPI0037C81727
MHGTDDVRGLLRPGDEGYDALCPAWNLAVTHRPAYVVAAESSEHIARAVAWAARNGVRVRVQATGHGALRPAGDELLILTDRLTGVSVDPETATALIQPGTRWKQVAEAAAPYGLAPLCGTSSSVGAVGFSLGGGLSWLSRKHGLASDAIVKAQLVTAGGELRWIDDRTAPDLMWALRGGGPNFGVVTALRVRLVPAAEVYGGALYWPVEQIRNVLTGYREWLEGVPVEVTSLAGVLHVPDNPAMPEHLRGRSFARVCLVHCGPGAPDLDRLRAIPGLVDDTTGPMPFTRIDEITQDPRDPLPISINAEVLTELSDGVIDHLASIAPRGAEPYLMLMVRHVGGGDHADSRASGSAYWSGEFVVATISIGAGQEIRDFGKRLAAGLGPAANGRVPFNFVGEPGEMCRVFTAEHERRLAELKRRHDPAAMFGGDRPITTPFATP